MKWPYLFDVDKNWRIDWIIFPNNLNNQCPDVMIVQSSFNQELIKSITTCLMLNSLIHSGDKAISETHDLRGHAHF